MSLLMASANPISGFGPAEAKIRFFGAPLTESDIRIPGDQARPLNLVAVPTEHRVDAFAEPLLLLAAPGAGIERCFDGQRETLARAPESAELAKQVLDAPIVVSNHVLLDRRR